MHIAATTFHQLDSRMKRAAMKTPVQNIASFATLRLLRVTLPATLFRAVRMTAHNRRQLQLQCGEPFDATALQQKDMTTMQ